MASDKRFVYFLLVKTSFFEKNVISTSNEMIQSVRDLWVSTLQSCGEVEQSMCEIKGAARLSSKQHLTNVFIHGFNSSTPSTSRMKG